jgi:orotidine-5'-phosphate decarboxylase
MASDHGESDQRDRLALALDVDDLVVALRLAQRVRPWFGVVKVGLELFAAAGPEAVLSLSAEGYRVFLDLKLHDIPTTVGRAARVIGGLGAQYTTVHTAGGAPMVRAAVDAMAEGATAAGMTPPCVLGVTVLTSDVDAPAETLRGRAELAATAGCGGLVCAAADLAVTRRAAPGLITVVPGIRPAGVASDDQARASSPGAALRAGADILVIGRAVTAAEDPEAAAAAVADEVAASVEAQRG